MTHRINALAFAVFASYLAIELGAPGPASATSECLTRPDLTGDQVGHWYYYVDGIHHRRCWYFETRELTMDPTALPNERSSMNEGSEQSWLSWLVAGLKERLSVGTLEPAPADDETTASNIPAPKPLKKSVRAIKHRSHVASRPEKHDAAGSSPQISPAVRDALFQEFLRRYGAESTTRP
jgi:hypothetical protein